METLKRVSVVALLMAASPVFATAQGTNTFDGTYAGVSAQNLGGMQGGSTSRCPTFAAPAPLTIANGQATSKWGGGSFDGQVGPDGSVRLKAANGGIFTGRIANQMITGRMQSACNYDLSWRKR